MYGRKREDHPALFLAVVILSLVFRRVWRALELGAAAPVLKLEPDLE